MTDDFADILAGVVAEQRTRAEGFLHRILMLRDQRTIIEAELRDLEGAVKEALLNDPTPLVDPERGIAATLKERKGPASIDVISLSRKAENERYIIEAAQMGFLTAALTPLRAQKGKSAAADVLLSAEMPGGVQQLLIIEKGK